MERNPIHDSERHGHIIRIAQAAQQEISDASSVMHKLGMIDHQEHTAIEGHIYNAWRLMLEALRRDFDKQKNGV
jgi:hypothetical protein